MTDEDDGELAQRTDQDELQQLALDDLLYLYKTTFYYKGYDYYKGHDSNQPIKAAENVASAMGLLKEFRYLLQTRKI